MKLPHQVSEATRRRNPEIFGALGGLQNPIRQPDKRSEIQDRKLERSTEGMGYRITILSCRRRLVDAHDNIRWGAKPLVDAITATLGFASDDNPRLHWEYGQRITQGNQGTIVIIETV